MRRLLALAFVIACNTPAAPPVAKPTKRTSPPGMPEIGEKCEGYSQDKYCIDDATLLACVDGRFDKQNCRDCTQIRHDGSGALETIQVDCDWPGLGAAGAACTRESRDCDGNTLVVCDGKTFHHYPCGSGCTVDHGVKCDTSNSRVGEACQDRGESYGACSAAPDSGALLRCVDGKWAIDNWCRGPKGCNIEGTAISCDTSQADVGQVCARGSSCSRDGKALLGCWDGFYKVLQECAGPDAHCGEVMLHGVSTWGCNHERLGEAGKPCVVRACSVDGKALLDCDDSWVFRVKEKCKKGCDPAGDPPHCR